MEETIKLKKMDWKVKFDSYEKQNTMPLDRAKIEALRAIAEQLETLNKTLDTGIGMLIDELAEIKIDGFKITKLREMPKNIKRIGNTITNAITSLWTQDILNFDLFLYDGDNWYQVE